MFGSLVDSQQSCRCCAFAQQSSVSNPFIVQANRPMGNIQRRYIHSELSMSQRVAHAGTNQSGYGMASMRSKNGSFQGF